MTKKLGIFIIVYPGDIFIYLEDLRQGYIGAVWWVIEVFKKYDFYANLKMCYFYQDKIKFLSFVISTNRIQIKEKKIKTVKKWSESKLIQDIQVFICFANFY